MLMSIHECKAILEKLKGRTISNVEVGEGINNRHTIVFSTDDGVMINLNAAFSTVTCTEPNKTEKPKHYNDDCYVAGGD